MCIGQGGSLATVEGGVALLSWVPPLHVAEVSFYVLRVSEVSAGKREYQWTLRSDQSYNHTLLLLGQDWLLIQLLIWPLH